MEFEINQAILSDAPYNDTNKELFLPVEQAGNDLLGDIVNGNPTCYLISGYRGAGKTSFIKKIEAEIRVTQQNVTSSDIVFVYLSFTKNESHGHLFRKLIRGLYLQLEEIHGNVDALLTALYQKTFYETSTSTNTSDKVEKTIESTTDKMSYWRLIISGVFAVFFGINAAAEIVKTSLIVNLAGLVLAGWDAISKIIKITQTNTAKNTEEEQLNIKSLYDDEIADYHFEAILKRLRPSYRIVFVFDEMDKIDSKDIDELLKEMKPYLVSGLASFIVVAGQSLFYKYFTAKMEDDALLSSIFSKAIHIQLLSRDELQDIFKYKLVKNFEALAETEKTLLECYADYLIFEAKRVPRKFISLVRKDTFWKENKAFLQVQAAIDYYKVFTAVNDVIDDIDDKEIATMGFDFALRDLFVMQLFLKCHQVLFNRKQAINVTDFKVSENEEGATKRWKFFLDDFLSILISELEKNKIIVKEGENAASYRLNVFNQPTALVSVTDSPQKAFLNQLTDFRAIVNNIAGALYTSSGTEKLTISRILQRLEQGKAIRIDWKNKDRLLQTFDNLDSFINDPVAIGDFQSALSRENFNLNKSIQNLLVYFGAKKAQDYFDRFGFKTVTGLTSKADLVIRSGQLAVTQLAFEFIFRRAHATPDKKILLQALNTLQKLTEATSLNTYMLLVVFTYEPFATFEKLKIQFNKSVEEIEGHDEYKHKVHFLPISTTGLHLLADFEFDNFGKKFIHDEFGFTFKDQPTPTLFPERNDHIIERVFKTNDWDFTIVINPGETNYWRFGLSFSENDSFPPVEEARHNNNRIADIHICAGDPENGDIKRWSTHEHLYLNNYHIDPVEDHFSPKRDYARQPITVKLFSKPENDLTYLEVIVKDESMGWRSYDLNRFKYFTISAWCDGQPYKLEAKLIMDFKEKLTIKDLSSE